ncbi:MAG: PrsW family intramembrane metalloprotease [Anaerolineae bacterium]|nr:PrsW family intramembrane metalloprotease [Anaerolineae bacterium]
MLADLLFGILSILASVIPTILYVLLLWRLDRYEKEPIKLLAIAFFWGAVPATIAAAVIESFFSLLGGGPLVDTVIGAPIIEESLKALALLGVFVLAFSEFDDVLDGIIYGAIIGFGFAMTENIFYLFSAQQDRSILGWLSMALGRTVLFGLNHSMFTSFTGVGFGLARSQRQFLLRLVLILGGLGVAIFAHALHNLFVSGGITCFLSILTNWLGVLVVLGIILLSWRRERRWLALYLPEEVEGGVLNPAILVLLLSKRQRLRHIWKTLGVAGWEQTRLWRQLASAATELAFKKHQQQVQKRQDQAKAIVALRKRILQLRRRLGEEVPANTCPQCGRPLPEGATDCPYCTSPE